ncbi:MAG: hypothetical protein WAV93_08950 [Bacteroidales bacterium]
MKRIFTATSVILVALLITTGTASAQGKKQVEKKITVVTVDEKGVKKDTAIVVSDTLEFEGENLIINTREGKRIIHRPGKESRMIYVDENMDFPVPVAAQVMRHKRVMAPGMNENEGVSYHLSVDGVVVSIRAPKEKAGEADQILKEVQKILMKK